MGRKLKETTIEEREIVINLVKKGHSYKEIAEIVKRPCSTIKSIVYRFASTAQHANKPRSGRPSILTQREKSAIVRKIKQNPRQTASKIASDVMSEYGKQVSVDTIRNVLHEANYNSRTARRKPLISKKNKKKRLEYAKTYLNHGPEYWNRVIFTDESKYNLFKSDGKVKVWRKPNTEMHERNLTCSVKHGGGSQMVWGCMSANGVGELHFIDGIMDHKMYIEILKQNLHKSVEKMGLSDNYVFTQDNDPKHVALNTRLWILYNVRKWVETPPQSPDINPIEHVWEILEKNIRNHHISNMQDLRHALKEEWAKITPEITSNLVNSMPRRLRAVIASKGGPTKY